MAIVARFSTRIIPILLLAISTTTAQEAFSRPRERAEIRRYLLSAGANDGGPDRVLLRYAVTDAKAYADVLTDMGGVDRKNALVLTDPSRRELLGGFAKIEELIAKDKDAGVRNEVFIYYSGHADAGGLKLGRETLFWQDFRNAVNGLDADIRVAIVDACGSGAITRAKGGDIYPAFMSDASTNMKGYAFLASSNADEASQESDRIKGSFFTHALLSGMRGAADLTGDGKVTINEAYLFAFNETLRRTQNTSAGTQHPSRDMNLAGTGDIVMTDISRTNAVLSLAPDAEGRFFIWGSGGGLFAEVTKQRDRALELGIPPGKYSVRKETPSGAWMSSDVVIAEGGKTVLSMGDMRKMARNRTTAKGDEPLGYSENPRGGLRYIAGKSIIDATIYADFSGSAGVSLRAGVPWIYGLAEYNTVADIKYVEPQQPPEQPPEDRPPNTCKDSENPCVTPPKTGGDVTNDPNKNEPARNPLYTAYGYAGWGVGTRFGMKGPFIVSLDFIDRAITHSDRGYGFYRLRLGADYTPLPYLSITAGVSANGIINWKGSGIEYEPPWKYYGNGNARYWPDFYLGLTTKIWSGR
jgi:hypothetical protein